jgi:hypothetical protein
MGRAREAAIGLITAVLIAAGCSGGGTGSGGHARPAATAPPSRPPTARADASHRSGALPSLFGRRRDGGPDALYPRTVGIPECDEYLFKFQRCMDEKAPAAHRSILEADFETLRESWVKDADQANDQARRALGVACKNMLVGVSRALTSYGCTW